MKAILLAAGLGTRLRPLTDALPKCLVPINGLPLLGIWLDCLDTAGVGPFLVNTHYLSDEVRRFVSASPYAAKTTLAHEPTLLGTGGTVLANRDFFGREPVLVAHADNLAICAWNEFVEGHRRRTPGTVLTMMTFDTDVPQSCGIVEVDAQGVVTAFHEKVKHPPGTLANGAVYILEPEVIDVMASIGGPSLDLSTQVIPRFIGRMQTWHNAGIHRDIGTPDSWRRAQDEMATKWPQRGSAAPV